MPLEKDNAKHRSMSNNMDNKHSGKGWYDKGVRPVIHGAYHAGRCVTSGNQAECARAKDQFSKVGSGQQRTDYLKAHGNAGKK